MDVAEIIKKGDHLFSKRLPLDSMWQEVGDLFYPERAEFTVTHNLGDHFADHLSTSYPLIARRELGDSMSAMLRPTQKHWFKMTTSQPDRISHAGKQWLERAGDIQRRAMYDRKAQFTRATKVADHDYIAFGQCVLSIEISRQYQTLLYRNWHLRDVVWCEGEDGAIDEVHHRMKLSLRTMAQRFKGKLAPGLRDDVIQKDPYREVECRRVVMPSWYYHGKKFKAPFVVIDIDVENKHVMNVQPSRRMIYLIPRWLLNGGSQYALSPAMIIAVPEARLLQAQTLTLLEAGEKSVDPPMIAKGAYIRDDINLYAGGITNVDADYDEKLGEILRPVMGDMKNLPLGVEMQRDSRNLIAEALYLSKLSLPVFPRETTATEIAKRVQEQIRQITPLFEPIEDEYNAPLCEQTFGILFEEGLFGPVEEMPEELRGQEIVFRFESPLHDAVEKAKAQTLMETAGLVGQIAAIDQTAIRNVNWNKALREAIEGNGAPATWLHSEEEVEEAAEQDRQKMEMAQSLAAMEQGAGVAEKASKAAINLTDSGVL